MALAQGLSEMKTVKPMSLHLQSMVVLLPMFNQDIKIVTSEAEDHIKITVKGLGLKSDRSKIEEP